MSKSNDEQYWDGFDNGVISTYETVCDEIKRIRESDEQGDSLSLLEDYVLAQKSVFELTFIRKKQEQTMSDYVNYRNKALSENVEVKTEYNFF